MNNDQLIETRLEQELQDFKKKLNHQDKEDFKYTTLTDLLKAIDNIQDEQALTKRMKHVKRASPFLEAMKQFSEVIEVFTNTSEIVAFVWGPVKFLLLTANAHAEAFNAILETYEEIGENIPLLEQYQEIFKANANMGQVLVLMYRDIMEFHSSAMKYFRGNAWRLVFSAVWKTFRSKFDSIILSLQRHKQLLANQATLIHFAQYHQDQGKLDDQLRKNEEDRVKLLAETRKIQAEHHRHQALEVTRWLSAANSNEDHTRASSVKADCTNSGKWLLNENLVKRWTKSPAPPSSLLWITGKPGAGKTVLASTLIEHCQTIQFAHVIFFYSKYNDPNRDSQIAVLRGVLAQLIRQKPDLISYVFESIATSGQIVLDDPKLALELLDTVLSATTERIYFILDGLDECLRSAKDKIHKFCRYLVDGFHQSAPRNIRCCIFSQDDTDIGSMLRGIPTLKLTPRHNEKDILAFCRLESKKIQAEFELPDDKIRTMADAVSTRAEGMFIYATLVMRNLSSQSSRKELWRELESIPETLDELYDRVLDRVLYDSKASDCRASKKLLSWLASATRPLRWHEIQCAVSYDPEDCSIDIEEGKLRKDPKRLCGSFIDIQVDNDHELRLVHLTAARFLKKRLAPDKQDLDLTCLCLNYLCLDCFHSDISDTALENYIFRGHYAFMDYALVSWPIHLRRTLSTYNSLSHDDIETLKVSLSRFFNEHPTSRTSTLKSDSFIRPLLKPFEKETFHDQLLHRLNAAGDITYRQDLSQFLKKSTDSDDSLVTQVCRIRTSTEALFNRSDSNQEPTINSLYGFKIYKCYKDRCQWFHEGFATGADRNGHSALHERPYTCTVSGCPHSGFRTAEQLKNHAKNHSAHEDASTFPWNRRDDIYKELTNGNRGAFDIWLDQYEGLIPMGELWLHPTSGPLTCKGPLLAAVKMDDLQMLRTIMKRTKPILYLDQRLSKDIKKTSLVVLLRRALAYNSFIVYEELLKLGDLSDSNLLSLFTLAVQKEWDDMARNFLEHPSFLKGSKSSRSERLATYLVASIRSGRLEVASHLVLDKGANPNTLLRSKNSNALSAAIEHDQIEIARFLLSTGKCDRTDEAVALKAYEKERLDCLELLYPVSSDHRDGRWYWRTRFLIAIRDNDTPTWRRILDSEKSNLVDLHEASRYMTPLCFAINHGNIAAVEAILPHFDIDLGEKYHVRDHQPIVRASILGLAIVTKHPKIVRLLVQQPGHDLDDTASARFSRRRGDFRRYSAKDLAKEYGNREIVEFIEARIQWDKISTHPKPMPPPGNDEDVVNQEDHDGSELPREDRENRETAQNESENGENGMKVEASDGSELPQEARENPTMAPDERGETQGSTSTQEMSQEHDEDMVDVENHDESEVLLEDWESSPTTPTGGDMLAWDRFLWQRGWRRE